MSRTTIPDARKHRHTQVRLGRFSRSPVGLADGLRHVRIGPPAHTKVSHGDLEAF